MWGTFLSEPLDIVALVCRYHSNQLMSREPIRIRRVFQARAMRPALSWEISRRFRRLCPGYGQVAHVLRTLPPVAARVLPPSAAPRLACVKPAASVHPEPGSNSSLYIHFISQFDPDNLFIFPKKKNQRSHFVLGTCCTNLSILSMNFPVISETGCKDSDFFVPSKLFLTFFSFSRKN